MAKKWARSIRAHADPVKLYCVGFLSSSRRKDLHNLSATCNDTLLIERVVSLFAFMSHAHQPGIAQDCQMMRDGGLTDANFVDNLGNAAIATAADFHDLLPSVISKCLGECYWINGLSLFSHIDIHLCEV